MKYPNGVPSREMLFQCPSSIRRCLPTTTSTTTLWTIIALFPITVNVLVGRIGNRRERGPSKRDTEKRRRRKRDKKSCSPSLPPCTLPLPQLLLFFSECVYGSASLLSNLLCRKRKNTKSLNRKRGNRTDGVSASFSIHLTVLVVIHTWAERSRLAQIPSRSSNLDPQIFQDNYGCYPQTAPHNAVLS